jgi:predicted membrane protein
MFIGVFFLLFGLSIILKTLFKIDLPVFRFLAALFFIYLGVRMLFGDYGWQVKAEPFKDRHSAVFSEGEFKWTPGESRQSFSVVFGDGKLDLTQASGAEPVEVHTVFGNMDVYLDPEKLTQVRANSVFGEVSMPDGQSVSFGSLQTRTPDHPGEPKLKVHAHCVFGGIRFHNRAPEHPLPTAETNKTGV